MFFLAGVECIVRGCEHIFFYSCLGWFFLCELILVLGRDWTVLLDFASLAINIDCKVSGVWVFLLR